MLNAPFSVDQLLRDPLTRLMMRADKLDESDVRRVFEDASRATKQTRQTDKWITAGRRVSAGFTQ